MDFYTMNRNFIADDVVDEFISAIWTERYSSSGDVQLVTAASLDLQQKLKEGTFLGLRGSNEVMEIQTVDIENNQMTTVGTALTDFLNERPFWYKNQNYQSSSDGPEAQIGDLTVTTKKVGQAIADVVSEMVINTSGVNSSMSAGIKLQWQSEQIANLTLGDIDISGVNERITFPIGPLYDAIKGVADQFGVGIQLYLEYATLESGYSLKFRVYRGVNRTTAQSNKTGNGTFPYNVVDPAPVVPWGSQLVRLVPDMDSLSDIKEIRSIALYKNVCYVWYKGVVSVHYEDPMNIPTGFDRRVMIVTAEGEPPARQISPTDQLTMDNQRRWMLGQQYSQPQPDIEGFRIQQAKDALANNNYVRAVDGQSSPHNDYKFGVDYGLGDVIELQSLSGTLSKARVTEYIRSQDRTGEREYPTISVI